VNSHGTSFDRDVNCPRSLSLQASSDIRYLPELVEFGLRPQLCTVEL
jgi:hypothetical protein